MDRSDRSSTPQPAAGLGRRQFLRGIAATGAAAGAGSLLAACGDSGAGTSRQPGLASLRRDVDEAADLRGAGDLGLGARTAAIAGRLAGRPGATRKPARGTREEGGVGEIGRDSNPN